MNKPIAPVPLSNPELCLKYAQTHLFDLCPDIMEMVYEQTIRCRKNCVLKDVNYDTWEPTLKKNYVRIFKELKSVNERNRYKLFIINHGRILLRLIRPNINGFNLQQIMSNISNIHYRRRGTNYSINLYGLYFHSWEPTNNTLIYDIHNTVVEINEACKINKLVGFRKSWSKRDKIRFLCNYKEPKSDRIKFM
jgi:hypothetical protein